jgi:hypothetical protein
MKKLILAYSVLLSLFQVAVFAAPKAPAPSPYRGSYYISAGYASQFYYSQPVKGTFGLGVLTVASNGNASFTTTFPFDGAAYIGGSWYNLDPFYGSGTGYISTAGYFYFTSITGNCVLNGTISSGLIRVGATGVGTFTDSYGSGTFSLIKYQ